MRRVLLLIAIMAVATIARQTPQGFTLVSMNVLDPNGCPYINAYVTVSLVDPGTNSKQISLNGTTSFQKVFVGYQTDSFANLTMQIPDNSVLDLSGDTGSQWLWSICSAQYTTPINTKYCFSWQGRITGATMNISSELQAAAATLPACSSSPTGNVNWYYNNSTLGVEPGGDFDDVLDGGTNVSIAATNDASHNRVHYAFNAFQQFQNSGSAVGSGEPILDVVNASSMTDDPTNHRVVLTVPSLSGAVLLSPSSTQNIIQPVSTNLQVNGDDVCVSGLFISGCPTAGIGCDPATVSSAEVCAGPLPGPGAPLQSNSGAWDETSGSSPWSRSLTFSTNVTSGDTILVIMSYWNGCGLIGAPPSPIPVTDSQGNTYSYVVGSETGNIGAGGDAELFTATASATGTLTVTNTSTCALHGFAINEFTSLGTFDTHGGGGQNYNTAGIWQGTITTGHASETIIGVSPAVSTFSTAVSNQLIDNTWNILPPGVTSYLNWTDYSQWSSVQKSAPIAGTYTITYNSSQNVAGCVSGCGATAYLWAFQTSAPGNIGPPTFRTLTLADMPTSLQIQSGRTSSTLGGSSLAAGACSTTTVTVTGAAVGQVPVVAPEANPGANFYWNGYVSAAATVTVQVCAATAGTPTAEYYDVRVLP